MARGSIRQYFPILSTTPINAAPAPPNSHVPTDPQHSIITTRQSGDSGSSRSQFRARQPLLLQDTSSQAVGTRVDAASPGASRAVCPQTAKDGEFLPAQAYERVRKRALKKALNKAATSGHSLYRGKTLYANVSVFPKNTCGDTLGYRTSSQGLFLELRWLNHNTLLPSFCAGYGNTVISRWSCCRKRTGLAPWSGLVRIGIFATPRR